jgi:hypothetical protein
MNLPNRRVPAFSFRLGNGIATVLLTAAAFLFLLILSAAPSYAQPKPIKSSSASKLVSWQTELKAWEQRLSALTAQRPNVDNAKWSALESDLKALANRFGQRTEEHVRKQATDKTTTLGVGELSPCPPRDDIPGYCCYLFPSPKGVCRYVCTPCKTSGPKP